MKNAEGFVFLTVSFIVIILLQSLDVIDLSTNNSFWFTISPLWSAVTVILFIIILRRKNRKRIRMFWKSIKNY